MAPTSSPGAGPRRRYDSSRRRADAEARQRAVVEAAAALFLDQGFGATSIDQIATAANVAAPTVYAMFGSKAGLLARAIDVAVAGDYEAVPLIDRMLNHAGAAGTDVAEKAARIASVNRALSERVAPLSRVLEQAAGTDPALMELRARAVTAIRSDCAAVIRMFFRTSLRPGVTESEAADIAAVIVTPYVYSMLTVDLGWPADRYEKWVADSLLRLLTGSDGSGT